TPAPPVADPAVLAPPAAGDAPLWDPLTLPYAPRRARPLSLRNPRAYWQLLFWAFAFPQALRWYVERFGAMPAAASAWQTARHDPAQRQLAIAGLILVGIEGLLIGLVVYLGQALLNARASVPNLPGNIVLGVVLGVLVSLVLAGGVALRWGVARGVV